MPTLPAAVLAAAVAAVTAAPSGWPATGEKVRVMSLAGRNLEKGVVVQTDAEFLTVSLGSGRSPVRIPLASIGRLEVARGRRTAARKGAFLGGVMGAVLGGLAVYGHRQALCENPSPTTCGGFAEGYLVGMGILGAAGAGVGALTGRAIKTDRWQHVPVDRVRVGIRPAPAAAGVQVSLGWGGR